MDFLKKQLESNIQYLEERIATRKAQREEIEVTDGHVEAYTKGLYDGFANCAELEIREYRLLLRLLENEVKKHA